ncbi:hypothetical protein VTK56DRAFT_10001 [Thermocarpiscus australiensis]
MSALPKTATLCGCYKHRPWYVSIYLKGGFLYEVHWCTLYRGQLIGLPCLRCLNCPSSMEHQLAWGRAGLMFDIPPLGSKRFGNHHPVNDRPETRKTYASPCSRRLACQLRVSALVSPYSRISLGWQQIGTHIGQLPPVEVFEAYSFSPTRRAKVPNSLANTVCPIRGCRTNTMF